MIELDLYLRERLPVDGKALFDFLENAEGEVRRAVKNRRTLRILVGDRAYFLKFHGGIGWGEILKNLLSFKRPAIGARAEYEGIRALDAVGAPSLCVSGWGVEERSLARRRSFLITEEITGHHKLSELTDSTDWRALSADAQARLRRRIIRAVARLAAAMHGAGLNHRDFYLCHLLLPAEALGASAPASASIAPPRLRVIDLHRMQRRRFFRRRWVIKDLGGLLFSAQGLRLTFRERLLFVRIYEGLPLRAALARRPAFWSAVERRAGRMRRKEEERRARSPRRLGWA